MLQYSETENVNAIELLICRKIQNSQRFPMDKETTNLLMQLLLAKNGDLIQIPQKEKPFLFQMIEGRIKACFTFEITEHRLILFLCHISQSPGTAILYLWYLQYWCFTKNVKVITMRMFCELIFPNGLPSDEDLKNIWDSQKVIRGEEKSYSSDNLVDYSKAGESIQFKK